MRRRSLLVLGVIVTGTWAALQGGEQQPGLFIPHSDTQGVLAPVVAKVTVSEAPVDGTSALPKSLAKSREEYTKTRDYMAHIVRQERVNGVLNAEQTGELRVRVQPYCISMKLLAPKSASGWEASFLTGKNEGKMRWRAEGVSGVNGFTNVAVDDVRARKVVAKPITEIGMLGMIQRVEKVLEVEKKANNPVQVLVGDYTFAQRAVKRFEIYCDRPHQFRYAHKVVICFDAESHLPVRFEAYEAPKYGQPGELLEMTSLVNVKLNNGLGDTHFER
jgi:hypothetical protein